MGSQGHPLDIVKLEAYEVRINFVTPYRVSYGTSEGITDVVVLLHTRSGLVGLGEADPLPPFTEEYSSGIMAALKGVIGPMVMGRRADLIGATAKMLDERVHNHLLAKGAVDMAMWDILGKHLKVPVHSLLGGLQHDKFSLLWPFGAFPPDVDPAAAVQAKIDEGYDTFMLKTGGSSQGPEEAVTVVKKINASLGDRITRDIHINVDANQGWTVPQAKAFLQGISGQRLSFVEQPLHARDEWALPELRRAGSHAISADEGIKTAGDALRLASGHLVDVFSLKASKNGGITRCMAVANIAAAAGVPILCNSMIELGITQAALLHVAAVLPNLVDGGHCFMSTLRLKDDVTDFGRLITRPDTGTAAAAPPGGPALGGEEEKLSGRVCVSVPLDAPGLGVALDMEKLEKYSLSRVEVLSESESTAN